MKTAFILLSRLWVAAVLIAPLSSFGADSDNAEKSKELGLTRLVLPDYPPLARVDGLVEGMVTIAYRRTPEGQARDVLVLQATHPRMGSAASEAVQAWRFQPTSDPAELEPRAVRFIMRVDGVVVVVSKKTLMDLMEDSDKMTDIAKPVSVPRLQDLARAPKALKQSMPAYPATLTGQKMEGTASVRFLVDQEGRVRLPEVLDATAPEFGEAALAAVSQWRYESPKMGSRPVVASDTWAFNFKANN